MFLRLKAAGKPLEMASKDLLFPNLHLKRHLSLVAKGIRRKKSEMIDEKCGEKNYQRNGQSSQTLCCARPQSLWQGLCWRL